MCARLYMHRRASESYFCEPCHLAERQRPVDREVPGKEAFAVVEVSALTVLLTSQVVGVKQWDVPARGCAADSVRWQDYDVKLNQTNIGNNNNKFYIIQVLRQGGRFFAWNRRRSQEHCLLVMIDRECLQVGACRRDRSIQIRALCK